MLETLFLTVHHWMTGGVFLAALGCFLWGVISVLFSPCHLASIPLIVGYVAGQEEMTETGRAARYAVAFTVGLFITIALVGVVTSFLGLMLGEIGPYWTILVGAVLIWVALDMLGIGVPALSGGALARLRFKGVAGALGLGLAYGLLSGSCTFGFIAPILAFITIQEKIALGLFYIVLFGFGHCIPIAVAGSSAALVGRVLQNDRFMRGSQWFRKAAGCAIGFLGLYFIFRPFLNI